MRGKAYSSYTNICPDAVRHTSDGLGWGIVCNFDRLPPFKQPLQSFDEHHLIINISRSPGRVNHLVEGFDGRHDFKGAVKPNELVFVPAGCPVSWNLLDAATAISIRLAPSYLDSVFGECGLDEIRLRPQVPARLPSIVGIGRRLLDTLRAADKIANQKWCKVKGSGLALELPANSCRTSMLASHQPRSRRLDRPCRKCETSSQVATWKGG